MIMPSLPVSPQMLSHIQLPTVYFPITAPGPAEPEVDQQLANIFQDLILPPAEPSAPVPIRLRSIVTIDQAGRPFSPEPFDPPQAMAGHVSNEFEDEIDPTLMERLGLEEGDEILYPNLL